MTGSLHHPGAEQIAATRITAGHDEDQGARTLRTHNEERAAHSICPRQAARRQGSFGGLPSSARSLSGLHLVQGRIRDSHPHT
jgi:hypothetical protein